MTWLGYIFVLALVVPALYLQEVLTEQAVKEDRRKKQELADMIADAIIKRSGA